MPRLPSHHIEKAASSLVRQKSDRVSWKCSQHTGSEAPKKTTQSSRSVDCFGGIEPPLVLPLGGIGMVGLDGALDDVQRIHGQPVCPSRHASGKQNLIGLEITLDLSLFEL